MKYVTHYNSPVGEILIIFSETGLQGIYFDSQKTPHKIIEGAIEAEKLVKMESL